MLVSSYTALFLYRVVALYAVGVVGGFVHVFIYRCIGIDAVGFAYIGLCLFIGVGGISFTDVFLYRCMRTWVDLGESMSTVIYKYTFLYKYTYLRCDVLGYRWRYGCTYSIRSIYS